MNETLYRWILPCALPEFIKDGWIVVKGKTFLGGWISILIMKGD